MESTTLKRRTMLGMLASTPVVVAACTDNDLGADGISAELAANVVPEMVPLSALQDADPDEVHLAYAPATPPAIARSEPRRFDVHLEVTEGMGMVDPDNEVMTEMWGFKVAGDSTTTTGAPGPVIRGRVGDVVRITLTNPSSNMHPHNLDFHAVSGMHGGASDLLVAPGESAAIQARLLYPGAFMYHCAAEDVPMHIAMGMYGMFIVDPAEPLPAADHEWAVMQSEWFVDEPGSDGMAAFNRQDVTDENPRYVTFNGAVGAIAGDNALKMKVGELARIYFVNEGLNLDSNFHPIGSHWDKVYPEGATHPDNRVIRGSQSTLVVAGGGTVVELLGMVPASIVLVDHALARAFDKGAIGHVEVEGDPDPEVYSKIEPPEGGGSGGGAVITPTTAAAAVGASTPVETTEVEIIKGAFDPANAERSYTRPRSR
ncbi:MAG: multicopper oxidase domain-containing protein [Microthrixaceae bacterium]